MRALMKDNHLHETLELNLEVMVIKNQSATMIQAGMFSGQLPWPETPDSETALLAQLCDLLDEGAR